MHSNWFHVRSREYPHPRPIKIRQFVPNLVLPLDGVPFLLLYFSHWSYTFQSSGFSFWWIIYHPCLISHATWVRVTYLLCSRAVLKKINKQSFTSVRSAFWTAKCNGNGSGPVFDSTSHLFRNSTKLSFFIPRATPTHSDKISDQPKIIMLPNVISNLISQIVQKSEIIFCVKNLLNLYSDILKQTLSFEFIFYCTWRG